MIILQKGELSHSSYTYTALYGLLFAQLQRNCSSQGIWCHLKLVCAPYLKYWGYSFMTQTGLTNWSLGSSNSLKQCYHHHPFKSVSLGTSILLLLSAVLQWLFLINQAAPQKVYSCQLHAAHCMKCLINVFSINISLIRSQPAGSHIVRVMPRPR